MQQEILDSVPQRPPFLFLDSVKERGEDSVVISKTLTGEEDFFKGHFPGNPIMPGVLMQEACFQAGAFLMAGDEGGGLGVVTKVENARFKGFVRPGDCMDIHVKVLDRLDNAVFFQGKITVAGKTVMGLKFTCAKVEQ